MPLIIRPCVPADAAALALVGQATFLDSYAGVIPGANILAHCEVEHAPGRYAAWLADPAYAFWIAWTGEGDGSPVGYAMLSPPDLPVETGPGDVELKRLYLLSRFHGGGDGAALMAAAVEAAGRRGATRLLLGVHGDNARAIGFYAAQDFTQVGVRKFRVGQSDYDDLVLARSV